jgi:hypothetical protein
LDKQKVIKDKIIKIKEVSAKDNLVEGMNEERVEQCKKDKNMEEEGTR